jgi:hypothetical protein
LLVASSEYSDETLQRLRAPGRDAEALADVLRNPKIGAFDVRTLLNLPSHELSRGIAEYCADSKPTDLLLLYFSCHGVVDDHGKLYYATVNTERRLLAATAVSAKWLNDQLKDCRARRQILILDCCHSGAFAGGMKGEADLALRGRFGRRGRVVVTASRATEYSFEEDQVVGTGASSVFTAALVQGLRTGDADRDKDGLVTVTELYEYVFERMEAAHARQTPAIWANGVEGNVLLAHSPRGAVITPVPLPEDLRATLDNPRSRIRESGVAELADLLDGGDQGLALTARQRLEQVAEDDIPRVAALAMAALGAEPGHAAEEIRKALERRARREAEARALREVQEGARREAEARARREAQERAQRDAEEWARQEADARAQREAQDRDRHQRQAEERARQEAEARAQHEVEERARREAEQRACRKAQIPTQREALRAFLTRREVAVTTVTALATIAILAAYFLVPGTATIMSHLPDSLRSSCRADEDRSATCRLPDETLVFFQLGYTQAEATAEITSDSDNQPCPSSAPPVGTAVTCRYSLGTHSGLAMFSHVAKDSQRFYLCRWVADKDSLLRGEMSTTSADSQDWATLEANWTGIVNEQ